MGEKGFIIDKVVSKKFVTHQSSGREKINTYLSHLKRP